MNSAFAPIAQRIVNAENSFIEIIQNISGCTKAEAVTNLEIITVSCNFSK